MMDERIAPLRAAFALNSRLLENCFVGVDDELAWRRPNEHTNSMAFLAAHLVDARQFLASLVGIQVDGVAKFFEDVRKIEELTEYPPLAEILAAWQEMGRRLESGLADLGDEALDAESPQEYPVDDRSVLGGVAFLLEHESYHLGQIALLRKFFGLPAMSYS